MQNVKKHIYAILIVVFTTGLFFINKSSSNTANVATITEAPVSTDAEITPNNSEALLVDDTIETDDEVHPLETTEQHDYFLAIKKMNSGDYLEAAELFKTLYTYADSEELLSTCLDQLYELTCQKLWRCEFKSAAEDFEYLGSYKNSENYLLLCKERIELSEHPTDTQYLRTEIIAKEYDYATMYCNYDAMIYVPHDCDENTAFFVFYPGGAAGEVYLPFQKVYDYVEDAHPNAIMYFNMTSGYCTYKGRNQHVIDNLKQIAIEKNIVVHNLIVCGASAGVYTAIHAASNFYTFAGIPTTKVIALDAALEWEDPAKLSDDELDTISLLGTEMLLFEQPGVRDEKEQIRDMINHNCHVTIVECQEKLHNLIAYNAFKYGVFSYALGMCDESGLKEGEYTFVNLNGK